jgi:hypothetical protein
MRCPGCHHMMLNTSCEEIPDDTGTMTITRWRCRPCHETAEQIRVSAGYRGSRPTTISYAVASSPNRRTPTRSYGGSRRGPVAHAVAC